ncbi:MAG TPA: HAD family phosphatase [Bacillota bacterium]|jgi:HAD superfamily hydrolase (TIGR01509 family)|nr:HAD family phosphatase [Bacillota bacterium]HQJ38308.1 HAD family phosphatase [Bacillota bacterium]HQL36853.1 HAD family phosphatase [Bacillota bacterium]HRS21851.1 HAD family phosphatase [Clostridia bacterium]
MYKDIKAVIFDVDGTLIDSMWIWKQVDIEFLGKRGIALPERLQMEIEGMSYSETAVYFKERFNLPESLEEIKEEWRLMAEDYYKCHIQLKSGAKEFLKLLYDKGLTLGIATSNSRELVDCMLANHGIRKYFSNIRTSCEVEKGKPYPDVYLKVAEDMGIDPCRCLVFEDTLSGVMAAKSAGMRVFAMADEISLESKDKLIELAEGYIHSFNEVMGYFA